MKIAVRRATPADLPAIQLIYNQGIEDRIATLETEAKSLEEMNAWFQQHGDRYAVLVAETDQEIVSVYSGAADLSIYVRREFRGRGIGTILLEHLEGTARSHGFYKIVLLTFPFNEAGRRLYQSPA